MDTVDVFRYVVLVGIVAGIAMTLVKSRRQRNQAARLPPGPPASIWSGAAYIPPQHPWRKLKEYSDTYGDLITVPMGNGRSLFVCGTATSADAILNKQSGATNGRPRLIMAGDLLSGGKRLLIIDHGDRFRKYRKIMHESLNNTVAVQYEDIQEREATITLEAIASDPGNFQRQFSRYAASVIMTITYNHPVRSLDDPLVSRVNECLGALGQWINPAASPLDSYPILNYIPKAINPWKKLGERLHRRELSLFLEVYQEVRRKAQAGKVQNCFASQLQERQQEYGLSDEEACYVAGSLFGAGSDTTASALAIFVMAMITHPRVMKKAQEELDRVVGPSRLPTFKDFDDLPYMRALCQEIGRWRPVSSGGFAHSLTDDVHYKGYVLPKGNSIVGNHWSIHLDHKEFENPDEFKPERFLKEDGRTVKGTWFSPKGHYQFGFGRRVCVGSNVAERSIFINASMLLWALDMRAPNNDIASVDTLAFTSAANSHPLPFDADIRYRSDSHKAVVQEARSVID